MTIPKSSVSPSRECLLQQYGVTLRAADDIRARLAQFTEGTADPTELLQQLTGWRMLIVELMHVVASFCRQHDLRLHMGSVLYLLVPDDQHPRLDAWLDEIRSLGPDPNPGRET